MEFAAFRPEKIARMQLKYSLRGLIDDNRIKRVKIIKDSEVVIEYAFEEKLKAKLREYNVLIDVSNRLMLQDDADWSRVAPAKQFCKHMDKVMVPAPEESRLT